MKTAWGIAIVELVIIILLITCNQPVTHIQVVRDNSSHRVALDVPKPTITYLHDTLFIDTLAVVNDFLSQREYHIPVKDKRLEGTLSVSVSKNQIDTVPVFIYKVLPPDTIRLTTVNPLFEDTDKPRWKVYAGIFSAHDITQFGPKIIVENKASNAYTVAYDVLGKKVLVGITWKITFRKNGKIKKTTEKSN